MTVLREVERSPLIRERLPVLAETYARVANARVRTSDNTDLERLIIDLQRNGLVERTRSQVVLSRLVSRGT